MVIQWMDIIWKGWQHIVIVHMIPYSTVCQAGNWSYQTHFNNFRYDLWRYGTEHVYKTLGYHLNYMHKLVS